MGEYEVIYSLEPTQLIFIMLGTFILSIVFHELGHWLTLRLTGSKSAKVYFYYDETIKLHTGEQKDYMFLKKEQKIAVYVLGILTGLIPIVLGGLFVHPAIYLVIAGYAMGCSTDIKLIWRNMRL